MIKAKIKYYGISNKIFIEFCGHIIRGKIFKKKKEVDK